MTTLGLLIEQAASLSAYARRLTGSGGADADDLLQETMLRCWVARRSFVPDTNLGAWMRTVMRNSFLSGRRRAPFHADLPEDAFDRLLGVAGGQGAAVDLRDVNRSEERRVGTGSVCQGRSRGWPRH